MSPGLSWHSSIMATLKTVVAERVSAVELSMVQRQYKY